jgi:hypothetical protein
MAGRSIGFRLKRLWQRHAPGEVLKYYLGGLYARGDAHNIFFMAGGLSFAILVCIVPLVLIALSIAGLVLEKAFIAGEVNAFIERIVPFFHCFHSWRGDRAIVPRAHKNALGNRPPAEQSTRVFFMNKL